MGDAMNLIKPMLAVRGKAFSRKDWIFEPKIDGARCIAFISGHTVELQNRRLNTIAYRYPEVVESLKQGILVIAF
jgi:ATP-dependent DNA ligase